MATYETYDTLLWPMDVRTISSSYSRFLRSFCEYSYVGENVGITWQLTSPLVTPYALSSSIFEQNVDQVLNSIINGASSFSVAILYILKEGINRNQMVSGLGTNAMAYVMDQNSPNTVAFMVNTYELTDNSTCSCFPPSQCLTPAAIYPNFMDQVLHVNRLQSNSTIVNGLQVGCYPIDGLFASTLECFFDASCIELLVPNATRFTPLDRNKLTRFSTNTPFQLLVNTLMVETLITNYSQSRYYDQCEPKICTYSHIRGPTVLFFVTTSLGVLGGYSTVLQIIILEMVTLVARVIRKLNGRKVHSTNTLILVNPSIQEPKGMLTCS